MYQKEPQKSGQIVDANAILIKVTFLILLRVTDRPSYSPQSYQTCHIKVPKVWKIQSWSFSRKLNFYHSDLYFASTLKIQTITKNCKKPNETLILSTFYHQTLNPQYITVCVKVVLVITQPLYWLLFHLFWMKSSWDLRTKKPRVLIQKRYLNILVSCLIF